MLPCERVFQKLKELGIPYELVEHPAVFTTEEADSYIEGIDGVRTKSLFLTNKRKTTDYLLIMDDAGRLDMKRFKTLIGASQLKFASEELLLDKLGVTAGSVSIFGVLNNAEKDVQVYFDQAILSEERMSFHPNDNTKTIFLVTKDLFVFLKALGFEWHVVAL